MTERALAGEEDLRALLTPWCRRYRPARMALGILAGCVALAAYIQNATLRALTESFHSFIPAGALGRFEFARRIASPGFGLPLLILGTFALLHAIRLVSEFAQRVLVARASGRMRTDLEAALLGHLLRHEDRRTTERPIAEILARIDQDVIRVVEQRVAASRIWQATLVAAGNLIYVAQIDLGLAIVLAVTCGAAAFLMHRLGRAAAEVDQHLVQASDRVRSALEETLWSRPEIHAAGLLARARDRVRKAQVLRELTATRSAQFGARLHVVNGSSYIATLSAMCIGVYFASAAHPDARAALIPVLLKVIPELFGSTRDISDGIVEVRLARSSEQRLIDFEAPAFTRPSGAPPARDFALTLDGATYQYATPGSGRQGGIVDATISLRPGCWTAITGSSGGGKSTMSQMILGRLRPQRGAARLAGRDVSDLSDEERQELLTYMPETVRLLDGTIRTNLAFGRRSDEDLRSLTSAQLGILEATGLAAICRTKALDLHPSPADLDSTLGRSVVALRAEFRTRAIELGATVAPFEAGWGADGATVAEMLLGGRCRPGEVVSRLLSADAIRTLRALSQTRLGQRLGAVAERVLQENEALLSAASYLEYTRLSTAPVDEPIWRLRSANLRAAARRPVAMMRIGLTALRSEVGAEFETAVPREETGPVRAILLQSMIPLDRGAIHPALTWRENAVFGRLSIANRRLAERIDAAFLEILRDWVLLGELTEQGLEYEVGSNGMRMSTGQRQLIAFCRTLLRDTPVLVLDEPTSALDAASRARVAAVLSRWKKNRILVTVTHDAILMEAADEVRVVDGGRLLPDGKSRGGVPSSVGDEGGEVSLA